MPIFVLCRDISADNFRDARARAASLLSRVPASVIVPESGIASIFTQRNNVLLPDPDAPIRTMTSPDLTTKSVGCRATIPLYDFDI